jgi:hypothetical protein
MDNYRCFAVILGRICSHPRNRGNMHTWRKGLSSVRYRLTNAPAAIPSVEHLLSGRMRGFDRLDDFEPFEFRVAECERLALARVLMRGAELFGLGPSRKILL